MTNRASVGDFDLVGMVRRHDHARFLATLFAPARSRPALWALLAFNIEIARVREAASQPIIGQIRLQWWREIIDEAYGGGPVRRQPIATELAAAIRTLDLPRPPLDALIDARERDLEDRPFEELASLEAYARATSATLLDAMLDIVRVAAADPARVAAHHVGIAWALIGLVRAMPYHRAQQRTVIALNSGGEGLTIRAIADRARWHVAQGGIGARAADREARPILALNRLARTLIFRLERADWDAAAPSVQADDPFAVVRLAWASVTGRV